MNLIKLECPNCGSMLNVEDTLNTCFCTYCGTKIMMSGMSKDELDAKVKSEGINKAYRYFEKKLDHKHEIDLMREEMYKKQEQDSWKVGLILFVLITICMLILKFG